MNVTIQKTKRYLVICDTVLKDIQNFQGFKFYRYKTRQRYIQILVRFFLWLDISLDKAPQDANRQDIVNYMKRYESLEQNTYRSNVYGILFYYNTILERGYSKFKFGKPRKKVYPIITNFELQRLLATTNRQTDKLLIKFLYSTGVRVSEVSQMKVNSAFQETLQDKVQGLVKNGKGGIDRNFYMSKQLSVELKAQLLERQNKNISSNYLFLNNTNKNKRSIRSIQYLIKRVCEKAKLGKNITPHSFRRSFATALYRQGVDIYKISKLLGHSSIKTTIRYIRMNQKDLEKHENPLDKLYSIQKKKKETKKLLNERIDSLEIKVEKVFQKVSRIEEMLMTYIEPIIQKKLKI